MNKSLLFGGVSSFLVAALHLAMIVGGPSWYRFFGAGEQMATLAEEGSWTPALVTLAITIIFTVWGLYAFSATGIVRPLPWLKFALLAIASIYILRGLALFPWLIQADRVDPFLVWTSLISLGIGIVHSLGLYQIWPNIPGP